MLDHSDFQDTDIPFEIPLPEKAFLTVCLLYVCVCVVVFLFYGNVRIGKGNS